MSYIGSTPTSQNFIAGTDYFNGTGSQTAFTLTRSVNSVNDIELVINNVIQQPNSYTVSGTTLTISAAPSSGTSNVYVRYLSTTLQSITVPNNSIDSSKLASLSSIPVTGGYTATLPAATGIVMVSGNMPAFSAYLSSSQSVSSGINTKVACDTEEFDTANCYNNSTYIFTPTVAGYYQFNLQISCRNATNITRISCSLYKNGTGVKNGTDIYNANNTIGYKTSCSVIVYANGTTDYFEFYAQVQTNAGTNQFSTNTGQDSYFQAYLVRAA
jgi:hypothetical protein